MDGVSFRLAWLGFRTHVAIARVLVHTMFPTDKSITRLRFGTENFRATIPALGTAATKSACRRQNPRTQRNDGYGVCSVSFQRDRLTASGSSKHGVKELLKATTQLTRSPRRETTRRNALPALPFSASHSTNTGGKKFIGF